MADRPKQLIGSGASANIVRIAGGTRIDKAFQYEVQQDAGNLLPSGSIGVDKKATDKLNDDVMVSGLRMFIREKSLSITRDRVNTELGVSGELERLLRKSVDKTIIYTSLSADEVQDFEPASRATIKVKIGDTFGRGAWTNMSVLADIAGVAGINIVGNVYEHWIKQFEVSDTETIFEAVQRLVSIFKPRIVYRAGSLYIMQAQRASSWAGMVTVPSLVESVRQTESLLDIPKKIRLLGGMGPFDPTKYPGTMRLASRSGVAKVGNHNYRWRDFGTSETTTETTTSVDHELLDGDATKVGIQSAKTVISRTSGIDAFGNTSFLREEHIENYSTLPNGAHIFYQGEDTFNKHTYTHWRYTNPRLVFTAKAVAQEIITLTEKKPGKQGTLDVKNAGTCKISFSDGLVKTHADQEAFFEENTYEYEKRTGRLKRKMVRRLADVIEYKVKSTVQGESDSIAWVVIPEVALHQIRGSLAQFPLDSEGETATVRYFQQAPVYIQHVSYKQLSKKHYGMTSIEYTLNSELPLLVYDVKTTISKIPAGDVPSSKIDYRKMQIWVEKTIPNGTGPVVEVSDSNIIDWQQAADILNEIAWQFTDNKRSTEVTLVGEFPIEAGTGVKNVILRHTKSGIQAEPLGNYATVAGVSRNKDANSGTVTTTLTLEGTIDGSSSVGSDLGALLVSPNST